MFETIERPFSPWPAVLGLAIVATAIFTVLCAQLFAPVIRPQRVRITTYKIIPLADPPKLRMAANLVRNEIRSAPPEHREQNSSGSTVSVVPGTPEWRHHAERGRKLDLEIVAEQSLPVLRAFGVPLAMDVRRPRGITLLYNLQNGSLTRGQVADDAVVREVEGLPAEFNAPLREAERELGTSPRVYALYFEELYSALRSLTEDALRQKSVPVESVRTARVRLSMGQGHEFTVTLVTYS